MAGDCILGLDLGTTTCRCLAFDRRGDVVGCASTEVAPEHPAPGRALVHADRWWEAARQVLRDVASQLARLAVRPVGLGLAGLQHAIVPLDAEGRVLAPSMLWMDQRAQAQVDWLNREARAILERVLGPGARASSTPSLPRLRWLSEHQPELLARAQTLLLPKDYVRYRLTGQAASDPSDAGGAMLYDPRSGDWSPDLLALAGVRPEQMPPILPPDALAGQVTPQAAAETGLPAGLPVAVGAGDTLATILGSGGEHAGRALIYIGTAAWVRRQGPRDRARFLATATTGAALRWLRDLLAGPGDGLSYEQMMAEAALAPPGAEGLVFLPHLCGERGPFPDPEARGLLAGLSLRHGRGHLARAVLEGACCHLRWLLEDDAAAAPDEIWAAGGAAYSALWMQTLAEVLGQPVHTPRITEAGALGAAILAAVAVGLYADRQQAVAAMVHPGPVYMPDLARAAQYNEVYARWRESEARWTRR
jgi:xylulokinase